MARITGLRSPHARVGRLVHFGRMLDKIRIAARGELAAEYVSNLGEAKPVYLDARCCRFLGVAYGELRGRTLAGGCDEEILAWAHALGGHRTDEECMIWNQFMTKLGWRDDRSVHLASRIAEFGLTGRGIETVCELLDLDEGRPLGGTRSWETCRVDTVILMGVAGSGKTTVGQALAASLDWEFIEGDSLHPPANVEKMSRGIPLGDADRAPWLESVRAAAAAVSARGASSVVACSALRESYRLALAPDPARIRFAFLRGDYALFSGRLASRQGHFMGEAMLRSQFDTLEEPRDALFLDASQPPEANVERVRAVMGIP